LRFVRFICFVSFVRSADFTRFAQCRTLITIQRAALLHISRVAGDADSVAQYVKRECYVDRREVPDYLHERLTDLWYKYLLIGGMPDAVQSFVDSADIVKIRNTQQAIFDTYEYDITKYVSDLVERRHIKSIYEAIPSQLNAENKRFKFSKLGKNIRFAHMQTAFDWLANAGIALPTSRVQNPEYPLTEHADENTFKLYMNDVGLLTSPMSI